MASVGKINREKKRAWRIVSRSWSTPTPLAAPGYAPATSREAYELAGGATLRGDPGRYPDGTR